MEKELIIEDNFEYFEGENGGTPSFFASDNHADIFDTAAQTVPQFGAIRNIAGGAGKLLGIGKEDKSDTGFKSFLSGFNGLPFYPTKDEVIAAAQQGKWDAAEPAAITVSYNPNTGQWKRGDWNFQITSNSPITVTQFKGAKERYVHTSPVNAKIPVNQSPSQASAGSGTPNVKSSLTPEQQAVINQLPAGTTPDQARQALVNAGLPVPANTNPFTGAANASGIGAGLFSGMSQNMMIGLILGVLALVALMIYFANK